VRTGRRASIDRPVDVNRWTAPESVIDPDPSTVDIYQAGYADYLIRQPSARSACAPNSRT